MSSYIQNYGFTKTLIQDNNHHSSNEIEWNSDYDGNIANINLNMNNNGNKEVILMRLNNNDLKELFGVQPIEIPLEKRLMNDFLSHKPIILEGALIKKNTRHRKKNKQKKRTRHRKKNIQKTTKRLL
jgi:hypothetical protein